jgi:carbonic anhydrase
MTASIEYAIAVLGVEHIIVCGHTDCGAMKGATDTSQLGDLPHVKEWLGHCRAATAVVKEKHGCVGTEHLEEVTCENIKLQMQHLRTHPVVAAKLATNQLKLHGWMYQLETGGITVYDEKSDQFVSIQEI